MCKLIYSSAFLSRAPERLMDIARKEEIVAAYSRPKSIFGFEGESPIRTKVAMSRLLRTGATVVIGTQSDRTASKWDALTEAGKKRKHAKGALPRVGSRHSKKILGEICEQIETARYDVAVAKRYCKGEKFKIICLEGSEWAYPYLGANAIHCKAERDGWRIRSFVDHIVFAVADFWGGILSLCYMFLQLGLPYLVLIYGDEVFLWIASYWPIWLRLASVMGAGLGLYYVRCNWRLVYGTVEAAVGLAIAHRSLVGAPYLATFLGVITALYVIVRSLDDIYQGLSENRKEQWERLFFRTQEREEQEVEV